MNKIDLIVSALEDYEANLEIRLKLFEQALAAAKELKALKPVAWIKQDGSSIEVSIMSAEYMRAEGFVPLIRLDEVMK
jgi:hypothetical protein